MCNPTIRPTVWSIEPRDDRKIAEKRMRDIVNKTVLEMKMDEKTKWR